MDRKEQRPQPNNIPPEFDLDLISLMPDSLHRTLFENAYYRNQKETPAGTIANRSKEIFGRDLRSEEINALFRFPERGLQSQTMMQAGEKENLLEVFSALYSLRHGEPEYAGSARLAFRNPGNLNMLIRHIDLVKTGEGAGLEIICRLEDFCRRNNIREIHCIANSKPIEKSGKTERHPNVGAYFWARCGFEFANLDELLAVRQKLDRYLLAHNIELERDIGTLKRPIEFAKLRGTDTEGNIIPVGKIFLTSTDIEWEGIRDLEPNSQGTRDFAEYLKEKGGGYNQ